MAKSIREYLDTPEHAKNTIAAAAVVAGAISLALFVVVALLAS